jgi:hypothetical protein
MAFQIQFHEGIGIARNIPLNGKVSSQALIKKGNHARSRTDD